MRARAFALSAALALGLLLFYSPVLFGKVLVDRDLFRLFIPDAAFLRECLARGEWPLWNPYQRLGTPFAATLYSQVYYPPHVLLLMLLSPARALTLQIILHVGLLAAGLYWLCRELGLSRAAASMGAVAAAFTPLLSQMTSQVNILSAAAWSGFIWVALIQLLRAPSRSRVATLAAVFALSILCGSPEVLIWQCVLGALLVVFEPGRRKILPAAAVLWAVALSAVALIPAAELASNSMRRVGQGDELSWSAGPKDLAGLALFQFERPDDTSQPRTDFLPAVFIGALVSGLALAGFLVARARPFAIGAVVLALLSLGQHFLLSRWLLLIPPLSLFRYPSRYLVGAAVALAVVAAFGLERAIAGKRRTVIAGALVAAVLAVSGIKGGLWAGAFIAAGAILVLLPRGAAALIVVLSLVELFAAQLRFRAPGWIRPNELEAASPLAEQIRARGGGRISVSLEDDERSRYAPPDLVKKSRAALYPLRWVEEHLVALEGYGAPEPILPTTATELHRPGKALFDLAGIRFFIRAGDSPLADVNAIETPEGLPRLYESPGAMPNAFVLHHARTAVDSQLLAMLSGETDEFRSTAFLDRPVAVDASCGSSATREDRGPGELVIQVDACAKGVLVIPDAYFPGWTAKLDGQTTELLRADYLFRAVIVPEGKHTVELSYLPRSAIIGSAISLLALLALLIALTDLRAAKPQNHG